jgi:hypothetical protein
VKINFKKLLTTRKQSYILIIVYEREVFIMYVCQLSKADQAELRDNITNILMNQGYAGEELNELVTLAMDEKIENLKELLTSEKQ